MEKLRSFSILPETADESRPSQPYSFHNIICAKINKHVLHCYYTIMLAEMQDQIKKRYVIDISFLQVA